MQGIHWYYFQLVKVTHNLGMSPHFWHSGAFLQYLLVSSVGVKATV